MSRQLGEAHDRELALERSRRELVAWVSHDLRSPLASIRAMAEALEDGVVDDPADVRATCARSGPRRTGWPLVDDLFELCRITAGVDRPGPASPVDVSLVDSVIDGVRPAARTRGRRRACAEVAGSAELASPAEAGRVLRNLRRQRGAPHTTAAPSRVSADAEVADALVSVVDECGGIPGEDLDRVFDVAFRGDAARGRDDGGGGLGLAIAKGLVEAQDGTIDVSNHPGGCCFTVRFPWAGRRTTAPALVDGSGPANRRDMSPTARTVPRTVPVTFDRPMRGR